MQMQTKVNFYILPESAIKARDLCACRIIEKALQKQNKIYVHFDDINPAQTFDTQLWTFRDIGFIPHTIYEPPMDKIYEPLPPVLIGCNVNNIQPPNPEYNLLFNFSSEIPLFFSNFNHIIEILINDENAKLIGRKHYKFYQSQDYKIETFNL